MEEYKYYGTIEELTEEENAEIIDIFDGCLIDNFLLSIDGGYMVALETYLNCWSSCYTVYKSDNYDTIITLFEERKTS